MLAEEHGQFLKNASVIDEENTIYRQVFKLKFLKSRKGKLSNILKGTNAKVNKEKAKKECK